MRWLHLLADAWREGIELYMLGAHGVRLGRREGEEIMPVRGVNTIKHHVNDWPAAIAFYRDTLGLKLAYAQDGVWASFETPDGGRIGLAMEREGVRRAPHVVVKVDGLDQLVADMRAAGAEIIEASMTTEYGKVAVVRDPAGNMIELVE